MGARWAISPLAVALVLGGCVAPSFSSRGGAPEELIPPLHEGDTATYDLLTSDGRFVSTFVIGARATVLDARGEPVEAVLVHRWVNGTETSARFRLLDAFDARTGAYVWSAEMCLLQSAPESCEQKVAFAFDGHGLPGLIGHAWAGYALANGLDALEDAGGGCRRLAKGPAALFEAARDAEPRFFPRMVPEGRGVEWCGDTPFPERVLTFRNERYALTSYRAGAGPEVRVAWAPAPAAPAARPAEAAPWNGRIPPGPEWPSDFPVEEAWAWLASKSAAFEDYRARHPDVHLVYAGVRREGEYGGPPLPVVGSPRLAKTVTREVAVGSATGESIQFELTKSWKLDGMPTEITEAPPTPTGAWPGLDRGTIAGSYLPARLVTERALAKLPGTWVDTQVVSVKDYMYRVLVSPPGGAKPVAGGGVMFSAVARADTGEWLQVVAPREFAYPR